MILRALAQATATLNQRACTKCDLPYFSKAIREQGYMEKPQPTFILVGQIA